MASRRTLGLIFGLGTLAMPALRGQQVSIVPRERPYRKPAVPQADIRVDSTLVLIPISVNDPKNRPVSGLEKQDFRLTDDGVTQNITTFAMDDAPVTVGLVFDTSGSMGQTLQRSRMAAAEFFKTANPDDEFFLVEFDNKPRLEVPLTHDTQKIDYQLLFSRSQGSTALLDAIYMALREMKYAHNQKKALLIISDGGDNHSRYTKAEVKDVVAESDVLIYAIGIFGRSNGLIEELTGPRLLSQITEQTGGHLLSGNPHNLPEVALKISTELRNRYLLGYSPTNKERDGRYHRVKVTVVPPRGLPKLRAHWRLGYYAPPN
jgi:Ca-activated chloride channel family protein